MKIVQSYWTKPSQKKKAINIFDRNKGGWVDKKYNYMSWALSSLQFKKFYDQVELVTDEQGHELLINKLKLPYTSVKVVLDNINGYHPDLWALGKIYSYSIQDAPFIHADGDVYIWEKFPDALEHSNLIGQNPEINNPYNETIFRKIKTNFKYIPGVILRSVESNKQVNSMNAGIIGGSNIPMIKEYTALAFEFVDKNYDELSKINIGEFNVLYEQVLFYSLSVDKRTPIQFLLKNVNYAFDGLIEFGEVPEKAKFIHSLGLAKRNESHGVHLARRLQIDYPEHYYLIMNLLHTYQI
jgi:hypothetical protein